MKWVVHFFMFFYRPIFILFLAVNTTILGIITIALSYFDPNGNRVHYIGKFWSRLNLLFSGVRVKVEGRENIEPGKPYVVMSNHQSHYDVWALIGYLPLQLRWVMKKELRKIPIFGLGCERMGHIYIDRKNPEQSHKELEIARKKFEAGASVVFFPEGTRSPDGNLLPFKKGGFVMALQHGLPILPITVNGSRKILPKGSLMLMPGKIDITIHPPVPTSGFSLETKEALMEKVRSIIQSGKRD
ncbi:MAG: 1-acyl-sn-glycerol-3-phosphate acyltransferase [Spirochaetes bacterium]|nr:1-acyl-sn-glycerol-3-phosphate acyltransferase [Spirochaetota bacterium]